MKDFYKKPIFWVAVAVILIIVFHKKLFGSSDKGKWVNDCVKRMSDNQCKNTGGHPCDPLPPDSFKDTCEKQFESLPKGDKFCCGGVVEVPTLESMGGAKRSMKSGGFIFGNITKPSDTTTNRLAIGIKHNCWQSNFTDLNGRKYHFEILGVNCSAHYISAAGTLIQTAINAGNFNRAEVLAMGINDIIKEGLSELNSGFYQETKNGYMEFKISIKQGKNYTS